MKIHHIFLTLILLGLLSSCRIPFAPVPATLTPEPTSTSTKVPTLTATITLTPFPSRTRVPTETPTASRTTRPSPTTQPTATSIYPVSQQTPLPDAGFVEITTENAVKLTTVFQIVQPNNWTTAISRDGKQLFVASNRGVFVYNRQGEQLAHWPAIMLPSQPCESCMSINTDGSRFAVMTHKDGKWLAQVYNIFENNANLLLEKPINVTFQGIPNEVSVALSPDGLLLAYGTAEGDTLLIDMNSSQVLLTNKGGATSAVFSPDGVYFIVRHARQMLFWKAPTWKNPINLLLPTEDASYTFSPDGKRLAIAETDKITGYRLDTLRPNREIAISTPKDLKRNWQIAFVDENILSGYATRWNTTHTKATVDFGQWDMETGATLQFGSHETNTPDGLSALWGASIPTTPSVSGLVMLSEQYDKFHFVDQDQLLINSLHSACWLKISSGETTCHNDLRYRILTSQTEAYREVPGARATTLQAWTGKILARLDQPYPFLFLNWSADLRFVNINDTTTDLYVGSENQLTQSFPGSLIHYAENTSKIVLTLLQKSSSMTMTMFDKPNQKVMYIRDIDFILKPLAVGTYGEVYFIQENIGGQPGVRLRKMDANGFPSDVALLPLALQPESMSMSTNGVFAFGMKDGNVAIVSPNGLQIANLQASYTPITGVALTPNGRYLAVASADGLRIFAVFP